MSYSITTAIDYTTDKIGKNSASIGAVKKLDVDRIIACAVLTLLQQNYYSASEPNAPVAGQLWYDSSVGYLKVYDGESWAAIAAAAGISNVVEDTTPQQGGILMANDFAYQLTAPLTADHTWTGITVSATAGENLTIGQVCYFKSDGKFWLADSDAATTTKGMLAMSTATIAAAAAGIFLLYGVLRDDTFAYTIGAELFVHTTGGVPTATAPTGTGDVQRIIGHAFPNADTIFFHPPSADYVEIKV